MKKCYKIVEFLPCMSKINVIFEKKSDSFKIWYLTFINLKRAFQKNMISERLFSILQDLKTYICMRRCFIEMNEQG